MKTDAVRSLRRKLAADTPVLGLWVTLESPSITEMAVALGIDWVVIDAEHGHLDWKEIVEHIRAAVRSDTVVLVRVAELSIGLIKRALGHRRRRDRDARGWRRRSSCGRPSRSRSSRRKECAGSAPSARPAGDSVSPSTRRKRTSTCWSCRLSSRSRVAGTSGRCCRWRAWTCSSLARPTTRRRPVIAGSGKGRAWPTKILAHQGRDSRGRQALRSDRDQPREPAGAQRAGLSHARRWDSTPGCCCAVCTRRWRPPAGTARSYPRFVPESAAPSAVPIARPPESLRPDRAEVLTAVGQGVATEIGRGVAFECLVGKTAGGTPSDHRSRDLRAGCSAGVPHAHVHGSGDVAVGCGDRGSGRPTLYAQRAGQHRDSAGLAHAAMNPAAEPAGGAAHRDGHRPAQPHAGRQVLLAPRHAGRCHGQGGGGARDASPHGPAIRSGPGASFVDYFNRDLVPGIEMSGGYGLFQLGGRLPAHVHDFDESICIVQGEATCIVEGRTVHACPTVRRRCSRAAVCTTSSTSRRPRWG